MKEKKKTDGWVSENIAKTKSIIVGTEWMQIP